MILSDDLDLPFGTIASAHGVPWRQAALSSILEGLGTKDVPRLRLGIGRPPGRMDPANYVLQNFSRDDMQAISEILDRAADATLTFVTDGLEKAMNKFNGG
jgi:PTH1 family peptidyl-tRNA hydrolase